MLVNNSSDQDGHNTDKSLMYNLNVCLQNQENSELSSLICFLAFLWKLLKNGSQLLLPAAVISTCWYLATVLQVQQLVL